MVARPTPGDGRACQSLQDPEPMALHSQDTSSDGYFRKPTPSNGNNCSERAFASANPGQNGVETSEVLSPNNDSLPSTSKHDSDGKDCRSEARQKQRTYSGPILQSGPSNGSMTDRDHIIERDAGVQPVSDKQKNGTRRANNLSGPLPLPTRASANSLSRVNNLSGPLSLPTRASANSLSAPIRSSAGYVGSLGDKPKRTMLEIKGRFSVTSENVDLGKVQEIPAINMSHKFQEGASLRKSASVGDWSVNDKTVSTNHQRKELCNSSVSRSVLIPHLQNLVKHTAFQQDLITNLLSSLQQNERVDAQSSSEYWE